MIGRPKDKKNNNSILLQEVLEPYYIYKVDKKTNVNTNVDTEVDLKLLPYIYLINIYIRKSVWPPVSTVGVQAGTR